MLIEALNKYQGTLVLVSHDRYFVSKTANKIWEIEEGIIKEFNGPYDEWLVYKAEKAAKAKLAEQGAAAPKVAAPKPEKKKVNDDELRQLKKELQSKQKAFQKLEEDLNQCKAEQAKVEASLADPSVYQDKEKFKQLDEQYKKLSHQSDALNKQYDKAFEELMALEEQLS
jgi:ATP-binding cassette subfamily F protein 3